MEKEERIEVLNKLYKVEEYFEEVKRQLHYAEIQIAILKDRVSKK